MRLLYWSDSWWPSVGGIEVLGEQCLTELKHRGFQPVVVTSQVAPELPELEERDGIPIHRLPIAEALRSRKLEAFASVLQRVRKLKQEFQPDLVHLNFPAPSGIFYLQTANVAPAPLLLAMHTSVPDWKAGAATLSGKLMQQCAWLTANSNATLALARSACPDIADRSSLNYNGVREPDFPACPLSFEPPVIACAARMVLKKGVDVAIRAMGIVHTRISAARLRIAGEGPELEALKRLTKELSLEEYVEFYGRVAPGKMSDWMSQATLVIVPSRSMEPFGMVAVEAMQVGRPVVATDQGGLVEVVADGETGFIVRAENAAELAERMMQLLEDPALASRMGAAGRARAQAHFGLAQHVDRIEALYRRLAR